MGCVGSRAHRPRREPRLHEYQEEGNRARHFAIGVTRDQALAAHAELLHDLREFRNQADADLAALLHEEMRECLRRYEERKQEAGALDFSIC
jgi:hypothetical protein